jgi:hypothetical protein
MQNNLFYIILFTTFSLSSCLTNIALKSMGVTETKVQVKYISNNEKQIVFLPMHHIGTEAFYKDEVRLVDSLVKSGYVVFYEGIYKGLITDSLQLDTMIMKFRKITGIPSKKNSKEQGYLDTANNTILGRKSTLIKKYKLRNQDVKYFKQFDSTIVKNVDIDLVNMIMFYEKKYGKIVLENFDYNIKIGEEYKHKASREKRKYIIEAARNTIVSEAVLKHRENKIALVYGKAHYNGVLKNLQAVDKNFKEVDKF